MGFRKLGIKTWTSAACIALLTLAQAGSAAAHAQPGSGSLTDAGAAPVGGKVQVDGGCYVRLPDLPRALYGGFGAYNPDTGVLAFAGGAEKLTSDLTEAHYELYSIALDGTMDAWNTIPYASSAGYLRDAGAGCREMTAVQLPNGDWVSVGGKGGCDGTTAKWGDIKELQVGAAADPASVRWVPNTGADLDSLPASLADGKFRLVRAFATYDTERDRIVFGQGTYDDEKDTMSQDKVYAATRQGSRWKVLQLRPTGPVPVRRFGSCAAYVYDKEAGVDGVIVLGGQQGGLAGTRSYQEVWWLDFAASAQGQWREITSRFGDMDAIGFRREGSCAYDPETTYFYGWMGRASSAIPDGASHSSGAWRVDLSALGDPSATLTWERLAKDNLVDPKGRRQAAGIYDPVNKRLFVIGGRKDIDEWSDVWAFYPDVTGQACADLDPYAPFRSPTAPTATPTPAATDTPGGPGPGPTATPRPTASPPEHQVCDFIRDRVPASVIDAALANVDSVAGHDLLCQPSLPASPWNTERRFLGLQSPNKPYHPVFNSIAWKCSCP
jgi:hypothetical protein